MPSGTGTVLLEQKVLNQSVVARVQLKQQSIWEPRTGQEASLFIGMTDAEAEAPILWPPDVKS